MANPLVSRLAALFIAPIMPSDRGNGLAMRTGFLLDAYAKRFAIDLAVVPLAGGTQEITPFVQARVRRAVVLPVGTPDTHFALLSSMTDSEARLAAFRLYGRPSVAARLNAEVESALLAFAGKAPYALVHVSRLYLATLAATWMDLKGRRPCLVLDCDEDDASAYRRFAKLYRTWGRHHQADWTNAEADGFRTLAARWLRRFDLLLAASAGEARRISQRAEDVDVAMIPNVAPSGASRCARPRARGNRRDILLIGNMSYLPNIDAATWFALRIWPRLRGLPFRLRFVIAGDGATRELLKLAQQPGIAVVGGFHDPARLYSDAALAVVPIRAGGGTRIKLLEGASYGVPMVATRFGAEGTGLRSGHELLVADGERDFAVACARLLTDFRLASRLAAGARRIIVRDYDAGRWTERLHDRIDALGKGVI